MLIKVLIVTVTIVPTVFQSVVGLSSDLELDTMDCCKDITKWAWFVQYCLAARMAKSLQCRSVIPVK